MSQKPFFEFSRMKNFQICMKQNNGRRLHDNDMLQTPMVSLISCFPTLSI